MFQIKVRDTLTQEAILSLPVAEFARIQLFQRLNSGEFSYGKFMSAARLKLYAAAGKIARHMGEHFRTRLGNQNVVFNANTAPIGT